MDSVTNFDSNPLQIIFLWHPDDKETVNPIIEFARKMLSPDSDYPFSHSIHLPIRLCTSLTAHVPAFLSRNRACAANVSFCFCRRQHYCL